jgi:hypothetical protein
LCHFLRGEKKEKIASSMRKKRCVKELGLFSTPYIKDIYAFDPELKKECCTIVD